MKRLILVLAVGAGAGQSGLVWLGRDLFANLYATQPAVVALAGLAVLMYAEDWTAQADDLFHALQPVASCITVVCDAMDEVGFKWRKGGDMAFLDAQYVQEAAA